MPDTHLNRAANLWPAITLFAVVALLPFARLSALPVAIMLVGGLVLAVRAPAGFWRRPAVRLYLALFACYWIPAFLSCFDAVEPAKSWQSTMAFLRFVPVGLFAIYYLASQRQRRFLWQAASVLVVFWSIDALVQSVVGVNLLGMHHSPDRLNGVFGDTNIKLGPVLAVLAPLPLEYARRELTRGWFFAAFSLILIVIVLVSTRSAWIMFGIVTLAYVYLYARGRPRRWLKAAVVVLTIAGLAGTAGYHLSPTLAERLDRSLMLLDGDNGNVDLALGWRLPIWRSAVQMAADHPINGVGVRGFRYAYFEYGAADDRWLDGDDGTGAAHAHQVLLEVLCETGIAGLAGLGLALFLAWRHWRGLAVAAKHRVLPFALGLGVMLFPVNTHLAFYSTFWSLLCWWLVMLYCAYASETDQP